MFSQLSRSTLFSSCVVAMAEPALAQQGADTELSYSVNASNAENAGILRASPGRS